MTKQFTRATVRKMKTDRSDALIIAKLALQGEGTPITTATFASAKSISRTAVKLNQMIQMLTLMQERFAASLPDDTEVLSYLRSPQAALEDSVAALRERSQRDADPSLKALLSSIPGIGPVIATILIAEIGSIDRFKDAKALVGVCRARSEGSAERHHPQTKYASDQALLAVSATRGVFLRRDRLTLRSGIEKILLEEPKRGVALPRSNGGNRSQAPLPHLCGVETRHVLHD
jgi:transposase